jgi:hypothetical protein
MNNMRIPADVTKAPHAMMPPQLISPIFVKTIDHFLQNFRLPIAAS